MPKTSERLSAVLASSACSGAMYPGVPIAACTPVSDWLPSSLRARPKSMSLALRISNVFCCLDLNGSMMLSGFKSRWMMPC